MKILQIYYSRGLSETKGILCIKEISFAIKKYVRNIYRKKSGGQAICRNITAT
jgi:hypothetical protein